MKRLALLPFLAAALIAAGCGSGSSTGDTTASATDGTAAQQTDDTMKNDHGMKEDHAMGGDDGMKEDDGMKADDGMKDEHGMKEETAMMTGGTRVKVVSSDYGQVIADGKGEAFYLFDREDTTKPQCYGACAKAWPPVLTEGKPVAAGGATQGLLGTTKRTDGKLQVTYAGHPLYYYVDDSPGTILCQDVDEFGGRWLVVRPSGRAAT